ncbi:tail fiber assembly protein [Sodalis endosymbiont of Spalangia cameroni]|uniref:tail fiber assembly protein n=1 Tax=Sodalis praecaptivus TaxID=1239307 RepID=UPI0031F7BC7B
MSFKESNEAQTIKIYNLRADTKEFIGAGDAYIPPSARMPANCTCIVPPEIPDGYVAIFDETHSLWFLEEDHRGETVYDVKNGAPILITKPGPLPEDTVSSAPVGPYDKWNGSKWIKDETTEKAAHIEEATKKRNRLIDMVCITIREWQSELLLGSLSDADKMSLKIWIDYLKAVKAINLTKAPNVIWPDIPDGADFK